MTQPDSQDPHALVGALAAIRDAIKWCRPLLKESDPEMVTAMLDTAAVTSEMTAILLQEVMPPADDDEPGTGEALERAGELAVDARRHFVTGLHLMAGARGIIADVAGSR